MSLMHVRMRVYVSVCTYVSIFIHTYIHESVHTPACACAHAHTHTRTYTQVLPWEYMVTRKLVGEELKVSLLRKQALILIIKTRSPVSEWGRDLVDAFET